MKNLLNLVAWIAVFFGLLMMFLGTLSGVFIGKSLIPAIDHLSTYFHIANSCFLITIALFVYLLRFKSEKE
ncbi:MAG: hypothetical protein IH591_01525 [Bacteroidales bacterium]|nr:hypothetical protein [Bacteroidales bacterium]